MDIYPPKGGIYPRTFCHTYEARELCHVMTRVVMVVMEGKKRRGLKKFKLPSRFARAFSAACGAHRCVVLIVAALA